MASKKAKVKVTKTVGAPNEVAETATAPKEATEAVAPPKEEVIETTTASKKEVIDTATAFCPKCGKAIAPDVVYCPFCGFNLKNPPTQAAPTMTVSTPTSSAPKQRSNLVRDIGIAVAVVSVAIVVLAALGAMSGGSGIFSSQHTVNITNGVINVGALAYTDYQFSVPSSAHGVSLQGSFTASGGGNNEIMAIVMNSGNFTNWSSGHSYQFYYESGRQTTATFNVNLPAGGTYYLVYNNQFSLLASKSVQTTVKLIYTS